MFTKNFKELKKGSYVCLSMLSLAFANQVHADDQFPDDNLNRITRSRVNSSWVPDSLEKKNDHRSHIIPLRGDPQKDLNEQPMGRARKPSGQKEDVSGKRRSTLQSVAKNYVDLAREMSTRSRQESARLQEEADFFIKEMSSLIDEIIEEISSVDKNTIKRMIDRGASWVKDKL